MGRSARLTPSRRLFSRVARRHFREPLPTLFDGGGADMGDETLICSGCRSGFHRRKTTWLYPCRQKYDHDRGVEVNMNETVIPTEEKRTACKKCKKTIGPV